MEKNKGVNNGAADRACCPSQLRYDIASKDWVVVASGRAKRPDAFKRERIKSAIDSKDCVFCNLQNQEPPIIIMADGKPAPVSPFPDNWSLAVIPNKYPAFCPPAGSKINRANEGSLYRSMDAVGFCEVVLTRDHNSHLALLGVDGVKEVIDAYHLRYLDLKARPFVGYISVFHNHGVEAGASQSHPHSQIITSPLIDVDLLNSINTSKKYYRKNGRCLSCDMTEWEMKNESRIVFQNKDFVAICPFASKGAFEVIISPKKHSPYFELIEENEKYSLAEAFSVVLGKINKGLGDPPYNFYLRATPNDGKDYSFSHWHWTILPKLSIPAGFEMGARMEISAIEPEKAAEYLRQQNL